MRIPSKTANLLRRHETLLFRESTISKRRRQAIFYGIIRPVLKWVHKELLAAGIEREELKSEIYLLSVDIFEGYNPNKSSIIPYLEKQIPWKISAFLKQARAKNRREEACPYPDLSLDFRGSESEFYFKTPQILFENTFLARELQRSQKYLINIILASEDNELSQLSIARKCKVKRGKIKKQLSEIADVFQDGGFYETR